VESTSPPSCPTTPLRYFLLQRTPPTGHSAHFPANMDDVIDDFNNDISTVATTTFESVSS
ncbi:hypothetical protein LSAT2_000095, partial [Lamellibrachia satsuma]